MDAGRFFVCSCYFTGAGCKLNCFEDSKLSKNVTLFVIAEISRESKNLFIFFKANCLWI